MADETTTQKLPEITQKIFIDSDFFTECQYKLNYTDIIYNNSKYKNRTYDGASICRLYNLNNIPIDSDDIICSRFLTNEDVLLITKKTYTVNFRDYEGAKLDSFIVEYGTDVSNYIEQDKLHMPSDTDEFDYEFDRWYLESNTINDATKDLKYVTKDLIVYPGYCKSYSVTFYYTPDPFDSSNKVVFATQKVVDHDFTGNCYATEPDDIPIVEPSSNGSTWKFDGWTPEVSTTLINKHTEFNATFINN